MTWLFSFTRWMIFKSLSNCKRNSVLNSLLFYFCLWNWLTSQILSQLELKYLSMEGHFCVILGVQFLGMFLCIFFIYQKNNFLLFERPFSLLSPMKKSEREKDCEWLPHSGEVLQRAKKEQTRVLLREQAGMWASVAVVRSSCGPIYTDIIRIFDFQKRRLSVGTLKHNA